MGDGGSDFYCWGVSHNGGARRAKVTVVISDFRRDDFVDNRPLEIPPTSQ